MRIIYIEDNKELGSIAKDCMEMEGHSVLWFTDRDSAHKELESNKFDLCISDYNIPYGKFTDTKQLCEKKGLRLILLTGETFSGQAPHLPCLKKPFRLEVLQKEIKRAS